MAGGRYILGFVALLVVMLFFFQSIIGAGERVTEVTLAINAEGYSATIFIDGTDTSKGFYPLRIVEVLGGVESSETVPISIKSFGELSPLITGSDFWTSADSSAGSGSVTYSVSAKSVYPLRFSQRQSHTVTCKGSCPAPLNDIIAKVKDLYGKDLLIKKMS